MTEQHPAAVDPGRPVPRLGNRHQASRDRWHPNRQPADRRGAEQKGGALEKIAYAIQTCLGGIVGNGKQYWSVVSLDELVSIIASVDTPGISGPVNAVSHAVTNEEFTKEFGSVIMRPTMFPLPAFAAKLALGEMANDLLLASTRVKPQQLVEHGYKFKHETLCRRDQSKLGVTTGRLHASEPRRLSCGPLKIHVCISWNRRPCETVHRS